MTSDPVLDGTVVRGEEVAPVVSDWGGIKWVATRGLIPGAEQTLGLCFIDPGRSNPLHYHPNCEELLYVLEGECDHRLNDQMVHLKPGDLIHVPAGVHHQATCTSWEPLRVVVSFSTGDRKMVPVEGITE